MYLTNAEARKLDRRAIEEFGIAGIVLMENAGHGMAELLFGLGVKGRVVICCGKGNNGGDGFVIARWLDARGVAVRVLLFCSPGELTGDAATNCQIVQKCDIPMSIPPTSLDDVALRRELADTEWIVDALFGSGLSGPVRPPYDRVIEAINASPARVFAVDIPSGLNSDTGLPLGATIRAHHTATILRDSRFEGMDGRSPRHRHRSAARSPGRALTFTARAGPVRTIAGRTGQARPARAAQRSTLASLGLRELAIAGPTRTGRHDSD
jgi:NAD(P)H-hydrate epimerase